MWEVRRELAARTAWVGHYAMYYSVGYLSLVLWNSLCLIIPISPLILIRSEFFHFDSRKYGHRTYRINLAIRPHKTENSKACSRQQDNYRKKLGLIHGGRRKIIPFS